MAGIIIGDVHGHFEGLMSLLTLAASPADKLYFLGDLIDRGPQSKQVIDFVKDGGHACLLGNHEAMALGALLGDANSYLNWLRNGGTQTLKEYGGITEGLNAFTANLDWLQSLPLYLDLGDLLLVHAGLMPGLPLEEQTAEECCWIRDEFLSSKKPLFLGEKTIIVGHTITFLLKTENGSQVPVGNLAQGPNWYDLETGVYHSKSGWLTALNWETQTVYQVNVLTDEARVRRLVDSATPVRLS
ncbi:serine/threonine protein phosphatase [Leptolyngbya sp. FACHB-321]|uniref:metallophosphoesterase n=1 Tax=Leptolyngbya sp. FACHB-321 TaxID=2692807 RepID=UPI001684B11A|nr:metallophosphoesterase [Leptolyngbya sp. FACHB-321]MBD2035311.1 serine/threonine protein phosphatase [Leptolyngbya sp. FACHB-321]